MAQDKYRQWVCPTMCGCIIQEKTTWVDSDGDGEIDDYTFDGPVAIVNQCAGHAAFPDLQSLNAELRHFHGRAYRPDTCGCSIAYYEDDREAPLDNGDTVQHPIHNPKYTKVCAAHTALTDVVEHHAAIFAENREKNVAVSAVADGLAMAAEDVPYVIDPKTRAVSIDAQKLGVQQDVVDAMVATAVTARADALAASQAARLETLADPENGG